MLSVYVWQKNNNNNNNLDLWLCSLGEEGAFHVLIACLWGNSFFFPLDFGKIIIIYDNQTFFLKKIIDHFDKNVQLFLW